MRGADFSSINMALSRMNQVQSMFDAAENAIESVDDISFDSMLQMAMTSGPGSMISPNQILNNLGYIVHDYNNGNRQVIDLSDPEKLISYGGYQMQAQAAGRFQKLEDLIAQEFPGRNVLVTSTTDGTHSDPNHYTGKAIDFVVDGMTKEESVKLEELCRQSGFSPYNEYIKTSRYKTGDHMHVDFEG